MWEERKDPLAQLPSENSDKQNYSCLNQFPKPRKLFFDIIAVRLFYFPLDCLSHARVVLHEFTYHIGEYGFQFSGIPCRLTKKSSQGLGSA